MSDGSKTTVVIAANGAATETLNDTDGTIYTYSRNASGQLIGTTTQSTDGTVFKQTIDPTIGTITDTETLAGTAANTAVITANSTGDSTVSLNGGTPVVVRPTPILPVSTVRANSSSPPPAPTAAPPTPPIPTLAQSRSPTTPTAFRKARPRLSTAPVEPTPKPSSTIKTARPPTPRSSSANTDGSGTVTQGTNPPINFTDGQKPSVDDSGNAVITSTGQNGNIITATTTTGGDTTTKKSPTRTAAMSCRPQFRMSTMGSTPWVNALPVIYDALNLIEAAGSGKPLPITASGLTIAKLFADPNSQLFSYLSGASEVANGALNIVNFENLI